MGRPAWPAILAGWQAEAGPPPRLDRPTFQFQRTGFFCVDSDSTKKKPVFNRVVALREDKEKQAQARGQAGARTCGCESLSPDAS